MLLKAPFLFVVFLKFLERFGGAKENFQAPQNEKRSQLEQQKPSHAKQSQAKPSQSTKPK
jgi:hypothetical protein